MTPHTQWLRSLKPGDQVNIINRGGDRISKIFKRFEDGHIVVECEPGVFKNNEMKFNLINVRLSKP